MKIWKARKAKIDRKGITGFEIAIIAAIATVTIVMSALLPQIFLKIHIVRTVEIQYGYNNAELALLALLSNKGLYEKLSFYVAGMEDNVDKGFSRSNIETMIKAKLDKLVPSKCYNLSYTTGEILSQRLSEGRCETEFRAISYIVLPDDRRKEEKLTLDISTGRLPKAEITPPEKYCCHNALIGEVKCETEGNCLAGGWEVEYVLCSNPIADCTTLD